MFMLMSERQIASRYDGALRARSARFYSPLTSLGMSSTSS